MRNIFLRITFQLKKPNKYMITYSLIFIGNNVKKYLILVFTILMACTNGSFCDATKPIDVVDRFDAQKYLGTWYEIARYPNWFEEGCVGVTAQYSFREDGQIDVVNTCRKNTLDGDISVAKGIARIEGIGKLSVTFTPWLPFARGDYWVLGLQDYQIAVVGNSSGKTGWILSRTPTITPQQRNWANSVLKNAGYDAMQLVDVLQ